MKNLLIFSSLLILLSCSQKKQDVVVKDQKSVILDWGKSINELDEEFIATETMFAESQVFINAQETYNFEGLTAHDIIYGFNNSMLQAVKIGLYSKDIKEILGLFNEKYGKAKIEKSDSMETYKWNKDTLHVNLIFEPNNGKGITATIYIGNELSTEDLLEIPMPEFEVNP